MSRSVGLQRWKELDSQRNGFMTRVEGYASVTLPHVLLPKHVDQNSSSIQYDWTSVGAQAVNNLANRFALNLFRPGVPFFRLDLADEVMVQLKQQGITEEDIRETLVVAEQRGIKVLDQEAVRPQIVNAFEHLIVTGNVLMDVEDTLNFTGLRNYVVRRALSGKHVEILTHFKLLKDELEDDVQRLLPLKKAEDVVEYVRHYVKRGKKWFMEQYVDSTHVLGAGKSWSEDNFPIHPLAWRLARNHNYGTGLVEDYSGDFSTLSSLAESEVKLALLMSDYRWLVSPSSQLNVEDFKRTVTGDAILGKDGDVAIASAGQMGQNLQWVSQSADKVIRRIGAGFMLGTAVTRNAERVTAEEMRQQAQELEITLGGAYSRMAVDMQLPIVGYLLRRVKVDIKGTQIVPSIVTGMDALSRNAEAQQLDVFLNRVTQLNTVPPDVLARLRLGEVLSTMAAASGLPSKRFVLSDEEFAQAQQQAQQAQMQMQAQQGLVDGAAGAIAKGAQ